MKFSPNSLAIASSLPPVVCRFVCDQHMREALIFHAQFTVKADLLLCCSEHFSFLVTAVLNTSVLLSVTGYRKTWKQFLMESCLSWGRGALEPKVLELGCLIETLGWADRALHAANHRGGISAPQSCSLGDAARAVLTTAQVRTWDVLGWDGKHWECPELLQSPVQQPSSALAPSLPEAFTVMTYPFVASAPWECLIT